MSIPPSVSSFQVILSSNDAIATQSNYSNFTVNVAGHLPMDTCEFYVRLVASEVSILPDTTHLKDLLSIHADIGQKSILATNARLSSNFLGLHKPSNSQGSSTHNNVDHNPFLRCSKPKLGQVNIQVKNAYDGQIALPLSSDGNTAGAITKVVLVLEFIPIEYMRIAREGQSYKAYGIQ